MYKEILVCLLFLLTHAINLSAQNTVKNTTDASAIACGDAFQITDVPDMYNDVEIVGDNIAWTTINGHLWLYNISKDEIKEIVPGDDYFVPYFKLTKDYLFYTDANGDLNNYEIETGISTSINIQTDIFEISELGIFWSDNNVINYVSGIDFNNVKTITIDQGTLTRFFVAGNYIYYFVLNNDLYEVYAYNTDLLSNESFLIDEFEKGINTFLTGILTIDRSLFYTNRKANGKNQVLHFHPDEHSESELLLEIDDDGLLVANNSTHLVFRHVDYITIYNFWDNNSFTVTADQGDGVGSVFLNQHILYWHTFEFNNDDIYGYDLHTNQSFVVANELNNFEFIFAHSQEYLVYGVGDSVEDHLFIRGHKSLSIIIQQVIDATNGENNGSIEIAYIGGSIAPLQVEWTGPDDFSANTLDIFNLAPGVYTLFVEDAVGCKTSATFGIEMSTGVKQIQPNKHIIFPNPAKDEIVIQQINTGDKAIEYAIYDQLGRQTKAVKKIKNLGSNFSISLEGIIPGVYFLKLTTESSAASTHRFMVK